ncbi:MAG: hypothetical protein WCQ90_10630, partial [Deltaproteobacteria bacterium]
FFSPACLQAYEYKVIKDERLERLVRYVCMVDDRAEERQAIPFPSLSAIFSGMLLAETDPLKQFHDGVEMLKIVLKDDVNPFSAMPDIPEWADYRKAKEINTEKLKNIQEETVLYNSKNGLRIGYLESEAIGGIGFLYEQGCDVVIMHNPSFGNPPVIKFTIAGNKKKISHLLKYFDTIESGWGGRNTIIGSPRTGTTLKPEIVIGIVKDNL